MKRFSSLLLLGVLATCSSKHDGEEGGADAGGPAGADASEPTVADTGTTGSGCPATAPGGTTGCASEGEICEYSYALTCPVGCSGGDYHSYQCSKGLWVDYRHSAGAPRCQCQALDFPKGMQGTWRFNQSGVPEQYVWIRFSALGDTLHDAGPPGEGTIEILAVPTIPTASIPWWTCRGPGRWLITQTPQSFEVRPPSNCSSTNGSEIYTLTSRQSDIPSSLPGCLLHVTMAASFGAQLEACKYPDTQCDAAMTTCRAP
jgi:hypothetical protein